MWGHTQSKSFLEQMLKLECLPLMTVFSKKKKKKEMTRETDFQFMLLFKLTPLNSNYADK